MRGTAKEIIKFLLEQDEGQVWNIDTVRNKDQNALYWKLIEVMARQLNISIPRLHNQQLRKYSTVMTIGGEKQMLMLKITDEIENAMEESTLIHALPTTHARPGADGESLYRMWYLLKPSHEMSKKEFSALIDGTLADAKEMGVRIPAQTT